MDTSVAHKIIAHSTKCYNDIFCNYVSSFTFRGNSDQMDRKVECSEHMYSILNKQQSHHLKWGIRYHQ